MKGLYSVFRARERRFRLIFYLLIIILALISALFYSPRVVASDVNEDEEEEEEEEEEEPTAEEIFADDLFHGKSTTMTCNLTFDVPIWLYDGASIDGDGYSLTFSSLDDYDGFINCFGDSCSISDVDIYCAYGSKCGNGIIANSGCAISLSEVSVSGFFQGMSSYGDVDMKDCSFCSNGNDGWIPHGKTSSGTIKNCDFSKNGDWSLPGGIADSFIATDSYAENPDYGAAGSGISCWGGDYTLEDCRLEKNENCGLVTQSEGTSGSPKTYDSYVKLKNCIISQNGGSDEKRANSGVYIKSLGCVEMDSGDVSDNLGDGIRISDGTFHHSGGTISNNGRWGVYQKGCYEICKKASVDDSNPIFLAEDHYIDLFGKLSYEDTIGVISTAEDDRKLARVCLYNSGSAPDSYVKKLNDRFETDFDKVYVKKKRTWIPGATVRAGNEVNADLDTMILSGLFKATYESGLSDEQKAIDTELKIKDLPEDEEFYWKEPFTFWGTAEIPTPKKRLTGTSGAAGYYPISNSLIFSGWKSTLKLDSEPLTSEVKVSAEKLSDDFVFKALWDFRFDLLFSSNNSTNKEKAPDYELYDFAADTKLPENDGPEHDPAFTAIDKGKTTGYFKKAYDHTAKEHYHYDKNREAYVDYHEQYAYEGWSKRNNCLYKDADIFHPGDMLGRVEMNYQDKLTWYLKELSDIKKAHGRTASYETVCIVLYAVWDRFPELQAFDRYFLKSEVKAKKVTQNELLKKVSSTDKEDGALKTGKQVVVQDYSSKDFDIKGDSGSVTVRYAATDLAGNTSFYDVKVHISSDEGAFSRLPAKEPKKADPVLPSEINTSPRKSPVYIRFISKDFFAPGSAASSTDAQRIASYNSGALEPYSVWYRDSSYNNALKRAFENLEKEIYTEKYTFSSSQISSAGNFVRLAGKKALKDSFRQEFYDTYLKPAKE